MVTMPCIFGTAQIDYLGPNCRAMYHFHSPLFFSSKKQVVPTWIYSCNRNWMCFISRFSFSFLFWGSVVLGNLSYFYMIIKLANPGIDSMPLSSWPLVFTYDNCLVQPATAFIVLSTNEFVLYYPMFYFAIFSIEYMYKQVTTRLEL